MFQAYQQTDISNRVALLIKITTTGEKICFKLININASKEQMILLVIYKSKNKYKLYKKGTENRQVKKDSTAQAIAKTKKTIKQIKVALKSLYKKRVNLE